jgi:polyhydroxyalkanoate synthesis regulator phasin
MISQVTIAGRLAGLSSCRGSTGCDRTAAAVSFTGMAQNDLLKRLLDAGMTFTAMTQARAEDLIRDLVRAGEVQAEQAQGVVDELVDRSRRNSERLIDAVRSEIRQQVANLGLATKDDIDRLERKIADVSSRAPAKKAASAAKGRPAKKASGPAKKARPAKKASKPAKRSAAKRSAR